MRRLIGLIGVLAVLFLLAVAGDRMAATLVADEAERQLARHGFRAPEVTIRGFPFVTQAYAKKYRHVDVRAAAVELDRATAKNVTATLRGVRVDDRFAPRSALVDMFVARATVPYSDVEQAAGVDGVRLRKGRGNQLRVTGGIAILGQTFKVAARGRINARGDHLRIIPTGFTIEGLGSLDDRLSALLEDRFAFDYPIPGLPDGVRVRSVTPAHAGFIVDVSGRDTPLRAP